MDLNTFSICQAPRPPGGPRKIFNSKRVPQRKKFGNPCFKENSSLHISSTKAGVYAKFLNELLSFTQKFVSIQPNFRMTLFIAQTVFHHCTFQVTAAQFVHHCTLKQAPHWIDEIRTV